jgi:hypothetical protein
MLAALLALAISDPTLDQAQTCRAHMEMLIEDVAREDGQVAGPTWFIRDWWDRKAADVGAPDDDGAAVAARRTELERQRTVRPDDFQSGRGACVDAALDAGAVPGMMRVRPE